MSDFRAYMICTSPRSGSTLLCGLLKATAIAGRPGSLFHRPALADWLAYHGLDAQEFPTEHAALQAIFEQAQRRGSGDTPIFGLRMQQGSFPFFLKQLERLHPGLPDDAARLTAAFGRMRFIHLRRPDKLAQAISCTRAEQTGLWHRAADGSELERLAPPAPPRYDPGAIAEHLDAFAAMDAAWEAWFTAQNITPLRLCYEDLARAPQATLAQVLDALGLNADVAAQVQPPTAKLADEISRDWAARFRAQGA